MTLKVTFDLEEKDLRYFRANIKEAREKATRLSEEQITSKAESMINEVRQAKVPAFVQQRLDQLSTLTQMIRDDEWDLAGQERKNVLATLAYFSEPMDIIPDSVPVLGYIDDAIMIELVVNELKHEFDAYSDFCRYRKEEKARNRNPNLSRDEYLQIKRRELHDRMRRRRSSMRSTRSTRRPRFRLF